MEVVTTVAAKAVKEVAKKEVSKKANEQVKKEISKKLSDMPSRAKDVKKDVQQSSTEKKITNVEKKVMEPPIKLKFTCPEGLDRKEFLRQIKGQERGLNSMDIKTWLENREKYKENGRAPEGKEAQRICRDKAYQSRIKHNRDAGMTKKQAIKEADKWIKEQAALHNPDQIAGGDPTKVSRMGDARVNSSIGSQWRNNIQELEDKIKEYAKDKSPEELANTKLNVSLVMGV